MKAQLNHTVCSAWRAGHCSDPQCRFRHYEDAEDRSTTPCYFETQPSGCTKMHCPFFHVKRTSNRLGALSANVVRQQPPAAPPTAPASTSPATTSTATQPPSQAPTRLQAGHTTQPRASVAAAASPRVPSSAVASPGGRRMPSATSLVAAKLKSEPHKGPATGTPVGRNSIMARVGRDAKGGEQRPGQQKPSVPPPRPSIHARLDRQEDSQESEEAGSVKSRLGGRLGGSAKADDNNKATRSQAAQEEDDRQSFRTERVNGRLRHVELNLARRRVEENIEASR